MPETDGASAPEGGLRERKRRETRQRIADAGIRLFLAQGYDATTLDMIAVAAGISRRTFFHYFRSKDEILLAMQGGFGEAIAVAVEDASADARPIDAALAALRKVSALYRRDEMVEIDRLLRSSEAVEARKLASFAGYERALLEALQRKWPAPERLEGLRVVAMTAMGLSRVALDAWQTDGGARPYDEFLMAAFAALGSELR